ncbi:MAG TPA: P-loop NTPase [Thermoanaerobaculia bacterium]|nr:P-loop NTPase [Thermoanaerobaculia bacterium]
MKTYHDIAGDGGSDVLGQVAARHRAVLDALAGVRRILAVGSGKGGVGKSLVTFALARAFRRRGLRVAILDADLNGPSQARMAGLEGAPLVPLDLPAGFPEEPPAAAGSSGATRPQGTVDRALAGAGPARLALPRRPDGIGVVSLGSLLPADRPLTFETVSQGEQQTWRATRELALLLQLLASVRWGELDLLLVDLPPGAERTVQYAELLAPLSELLPEERIAAAPDAPEPASAAGDGKVTIREATAGSDPGRLAFLMVTVPSDVSRSVVARSLAALRETPAPLLGSVENMAGYSCLGCGEVRQLFPEPTVTLDAPCLGRIPFDPALAELCDRGWPEGAAVEERSEAFRRIEELAAAIQERWQRPASAGASAREGLKRPSSVSAGEGGRNELKRPSSVSAGAGGGPDREPIEEVSR